MSAPGDGAPDAIHALVIRLNLIPTEACRDLLEFAARLSAQKRSRRGELSCTGVFYAALRFSQFMAPLGREGVVFRDFAGSASSRIGSDRLSELMGEYYAEGSVETEPPPLSSLPPVRLRKTLEGALLGWSRISGRPATSINSLQLIQVVLEAQDVNLHRRLKSLGVDPAELLFILSRFLPMVSPEPELGGEPEPEPELEPVTGPATASPQTPVIAAEEAGEKNDPKAALRPAHDVRTRMDRDPDDPAQLSLGIDVYAAALATIFRSARHEFSFGLFGPWGTGKTRLVLSLAKLLTSPSDYADAMKNRNETVGGDPNDKLVYELVWYSAWKYRRPPEAWIFLYETMAQRAMKAPIFRRLGLIVRTSVIRNGYLSLIAVLIMFGLFAVPQDEFWSQTLARGVGAVGLGGLLYATGLAESGRDAVRALASRYATLARHGERLGLQALVGNDLRALLLGWIPQVEEIGADGNSVPAPPFVSAPATFLTVAALCAFTGFWFWTMTASSRLENAWLYSALFVIWGAVVTGVLFALQSSQGAPDRILLVVDDLDRCSPTEVVDIVESLKLMLEDPDVQNRVQILMLVDESVLNHAIADKFQSLMEGRIVQLSAKEKEDMRRSLIREHVEKLFACYLRLPVINAGEIAELARRYTEGDLRRWEIAQKKAEETKPASGVGTPVPSPESATNGSAPFPLGVELPAGPAVPPASGPKPSSKPDAAPAAEVSRRLRFDSKEIALVQAKLADYMLTSGYRPSPRSIRIFLFKYQLCRLLVQLWRGQNRADATDEDTTLIFETLAKACFSKPALQAVISDANRSDLDRIVAQVC